MEELSNEVRPGGENAEPKKETRNEKSAKAPKNSTASWAFGIRIREKNPCGRPERMLPSGGIKEIDGRVYEGEGQKGEREAENRPFQRFFSFLQLLVVTEGRYHVEAGENDSRYGDDGSKGDDAVGYGDDLSFHAVFYDPVPNGNGAFGLGNSGTFASETGGNVVSHFPTTGGGDLGKRKRNRDERNGEAKQDEFGERSGEPHGWNRYVILNPVTIRMMA